MKDLKISKELIKAVLEKETKTLSKDFNFTINENYIEFSDDGEMQFEYCIYKFAFKCKEWALNKGYIIDSLIRGYCSGKAICFVYVDDWQSEFSENCLKSFTSSTEIESIVKSCKWILNEVNK